jgi:polyisoprenoid-binding protein YceI
MSVTIDNTTEKKTWVVDPVHSSVEFATKHMMVTTVRGRFEKFDAVVDFDEANPASSSVEARIEAASIDTRAADRDGHLRSSDFLDAENYPYITFKSTRIEPDGDDRYLISGDLTIRGVTKHVVLDTEFAGIGKSPWGNRVAALSAETKINRKDFGLVWNVGLGTGGWLVGDEVRIHIDLELVEQ